MFPYPGGCFFRVHGLDEIQRPCSLTNQIVSTMFRSMTLFNQHVCTKSNIQVPTYWRCCHAYMHIHLRSLNSHSFCSTVSSSAINWSWHSCYRWWWWYNWRCCFVLLWRRVWADRKCKPEMWKTRWLYCSISTGPSNLQSWVLHECHRLTTCRLTTSTCMYMPFSGVNYARIQNATSA